MFDSELNMVLGTYTYLGLLLRFGAVDCAAPAYGSF